MLVSSPASLSNSLSFRLTPLCAGDRGNELVEEVIESAGEMRPVKIEALDRVLLPSGRGSGGRMECFLVGNAGRWGAAIVERKMQKVTMSHQPPTPLSQY